MFTDISVNYIVKQIWKRLVILENEHVDYVEILTYVQLFSFFADLLFKLNADLIQNATNTQEFLFFKCSRSVPILPFILYLHYSTVI